MKRNVCRYCGKPLNNGLDFCGMECEKSYDKTVKCEQARVKYFAVGIIVGILVMFLGVFSGRHQVTGAGIIIAGITIVFLPFATPETSGLLGIRRSRVLGRILGLCAIAVGVWVGFF